MKTEIYYLEKKHGDLFNRYMFYRHLCLIGNKIEDSNLSQKAYHVRDATVILSSMREDCDVVTLSASSKRKVSSAKKTIDKILEEESIGVNDIKLMEQPPENGR